MRWGKPSKYPKYLGVLTAEQCIFQLYFFLIFVHFLSVQIDSPSPLLFKYALKYPCSLRNCVSSYPPPVCAINLKTHIQCQTSSPLPSSSMTPSLLTLPQYFCLNLWFSVPLYPILSYNVNRGNTCQYQHSLSRDCTVSPHYPEYKTILHAHQFGHYPFLGQGPLPHLYSIQQSGPHNLSQLAFARSKHPVY